uniref:Reverse transcriptase domain-containing protein n=1 Tax=Lactuca sativa TaxID=4236 RepID=A0A9R1XGR6_LACSA|nr:hypothetical protein LSAT_V11C500238820 [Lactuca sativa]
MRGITDDVQSTYVEGWYILDGPMIVNDVCSRAKILIRRYCFSKFILTKHLTRFWIKGFMKSARASILINGVPTREFLMEKVLRQGDPLSPFLFITAMEGFNVALKSACNKVLKLNFNKSRVFGVGSTLAETTWWVSTFGCEPTCLPFTYIGNNWKPIIGKYMSKLTVWKSKTLSFKGGLTLIMVILGNLPTYYLSLFVAPVGLLDQLEEIRIDFLWGGVDGASKFSITTKDEGRLGVGSIKALNIVLIWRLSSNVALLWSQDISSIQNLHSRHVE